MTEAIVKKNRLQSREADGQTTSPLRDDGELQGAATTTPLFYEPMLGDVKYIQRKGGQGGRTREKAIILFTEETHDDPSSSSARSCFGRIGFPPFSRLSALCPF